jgi:hypothetical protein
MQSAISPSGPRKHLSLAELDRTAWRSFLSEAYAASNGRPDLTTFRAPYAKPDWVRELREEEETDRRSSHDS